MKIITLAMLLLCTMISQAQLRTIHVYVALCDNVNQGIVPVSATLGNGQKASTNLYWGAGFGVKTFLKKKSSNWILKETIVNPSSNILERLVFKHKTEDVYLLADAYDGAEIKAAITDFLISCSGKGVTEIQIDSTKISFGGQSDLLAYTGHDGLMEFDVEEALNQQNPKHRDAIILACISKEFFSEYLTQTGAYPLVWTTGLMAPEAYTLSWAIYMKMINAVISQLYTS